MKLRVSTRRVDDRNSAPLLVAFVLCDMARHWRSTGVTLQDESFSFLLLVSNRTPRGVAEILQPDRVL
jgi:hypothetical protein